MSDALLHALAGDWIGETLSGLPDKRINNAFLAAVLAFASHALLDTIDQDYTPDWTAWRADAKRFKEDLPYVAAQVTGLAAALLAVFQEKDKQRLQTRLAAILGALAPDLIDGVYAYLHPDVWRTGNLLLPWHKATNSGKGEMTRDESLRRTVFLTLLRVKF